MKTPLLACLTLVTGVLGAPVGAQDPGDLFDNVVEVLETRYWDRQFRAEQLPQLVAWFRPAATAATTLAEECAVVDGLLARVPSSHLALYSRAALESMLGELSGRLQRTLGFQVKQQASRFFACKILDDGPADRAGLRRGDRIVSIDGRAPQVSPRLGRRTDDAYLPDAPLHALLVDPKANERVELVVERRPGQTRALVVESVRYSALRAAKASARVVEQGGVRIGYVHFWYIHGGCVRLLQKLAAGQFAGCDALVLDLRGRGGNATEARRIVEFFCGRRRGWTRPFVALMDRESRSAKEMLAYEFKQRRAALIIGERSAGALVPAMFQSVGQGLVLMFPGTRIGTYSDAVELKGVAPDIAVAYPLAYTGGDDPVLGRALRQLAAPPPRSTDPGASGRRSRRR